MVFMRLFFFLSLFLQVLLQGEAPVLHGTLKNGMTYYVKENNHPAGKAFMQLVVKVGSVYEEDHEQGIAHFLEHLNFRGSENFKDGELDRYLDAIGASTRNAMTDFDTTIYYIGIPLDKEGVFDTSLMFIRDFAGFASLNAEPIGKERHVVLNEMHQSFASPGRKLFKKQILQEFPGSLFVTRSPIGTEEIISNVTPETLRTFYKKWYRPDRMAVIVVGDFDGYEVEKKVQKLFGAIVNPKEKVTEPDLKIFLPTKDQQEVYFDTMLDRTGAVLNFPIVYADPSSIPDKERVKMRLAERVIVQLISDRLQAKQEEGVYPHISVGIENLPSILQGFISVDLFEDQLEEGLQAVFYELQRIKAHGFTEGELQAWKKKEQAKKELEPGVVHRGHQALVQDFQDHFLNKEGYLLEEKRELFEQETFNTLTVKDLNKAFKESPFVAPKSLFVHTSSEEVKEKLQEKDLLALAKFDEITPYVYQTIDPQLEDERLSPGFIAASKRDEKSGITEWTLSNGVKVLLKKTDFEHKQIYLSAIAKGGLAQFSEEILPSAHFADWGFDGFKGLSSSETKKLLANKRIRSDVELEGGYRAINYSVGENNLQTAFQAIHYSFADPNFDPKSWARRLVIAKEIERQIAKKPGAQFDQVVKKVTSNDHFYFKNLDVKELDPEKAKMAFKALFGNPADFTLLIVGDFDEENIANLVKTYIGSLKGSKKQAYVPSFSPEPLSNETIELDFVRGNQTFANNEVLFSIDLESIMNSHKSWTSSYSIVHLLQDRLWKVLREEHGKTYGVHVKLLTPFSPSLAFSQLQIDFTCKPEDRKFMVDLVLQEIEKLKNTFPTEEELAVVKASYEEGLKQGQATNDFWIKRLKFSQLYDVDQSFAFDLEKNGSLLNSVTMKKTAMSMFADSNYAVFYHLPENE